MALDFGNAKQKNEQQFREELRILATQIETINQQLAGGTGGGTGGGLASSKAFNDINTKLSYLYEFLKTLQTDIHADTKTSVEQVGVSVNATLQKNLGDIYAQLQEVQVSLKAVHAGGGVDEQSVEDIRTTIKELIKVYRDEVEVFKAQNAFLQKKLVDIEQRLSGLEK